MKYMIEDDADEHKANQDRLQDPDTMAFIRPARKMPSIKEMNAWFEGILNAEIDGKQRAWAVSVLEKWWIIISGRKAQQAKLEYYKTRVTDLIKWKRVRQKRQSIGQVGPIIPFDKEYEAMMVIKKKSSLIKDGLDEHFRMIKVRADAVRSEKQAKKSAHKKFKERAERNKGMNKNSKWHLDRAAGSWLPANGKDKSETVSREGEGRRVQRKNRRLKEKLEAAKRAEFLARTAPVAEAVDISTSSIEMTDEMVQEAADREQEEVDMSVELARINRVCVAKLTQKEKENEEKRKKKEEDDKEKKEEEDFILAMAKNIGIKIKPIGNLLEKRQKKKESLKINVGISLIEQANRKRYNIDNRYRIRSDAFDSLTKKDKQAEVFKFTSICNSVTLNKPCYHRNCRFAHSVEQLRNRECRFFSECKFVEFIGDGLYKNRKFGHTGKKCSCLHPGENKRSLCHRLGLKYTPKQSTAAVINNTEIKPDTNLINKPVLDTSLSVRTKAWSTVVKTVDNKITNSTLAWSDIVVKSLSIEEKTALYGKGVKILGPIDETSDKKPIALNTTRKPTDKSGLGFSHSKQTTKSSSNVLAPGFNWVKGEVINQTQEIPIKSDFTSTASLEIDNTLDRKMPTNTIDMRRWHQQEVDRRILNQEEMDRRRWHQQEMDRRRWHQQMNQQEMDRRRWYHQIMNQQQQMNQQEIDRRRFQKPAMNQQEIDRRRWYQQIMNQQQPMNQQEMDRRRWYQQEMDRRRWHQQMNQQEMDMRILNR